MDFHLEPTAQIHPAGILRPIGISENILDFLTTEVINNIGLKTQSL